MNAVTDAFLTADRATAPRVPEGRLWSAEDLRDPYPLYAELRASAPIHWSDTLFGGAWIISRQHEAELVLRDTQHFSAQRTGGWVMGGEPGEGTGRQSRLELTKFQQLISRAFLFVDGTDHAPLRGLLHAGFTPSGLEALRPWLAQRIEQLMDALEATHAARPDEPVDFIQHLARQLPACAMHLARIESGADPVMVLAAEAF